MLSDPVAEAFGLIHHHPSGENFWHGMAESENTTENTTENTSYTRKYSSRINAGAFECVDIFLAFGIPEQHLDPRQPRSRQSQMNANSKQTRILLKLV